MNLRSCLATAIGVLFFSILSCNQDANKCPDSTTCFLVKIREPISDETFLVASNKETFIQKIRAELAKPVDDRLHVNGRIARGDGEFNSPWSWHIDPEKWELAENSMELCDGLPSDIESNMEYWLNTVGRFCPWQSYIHLEIQN